MTIMGQPTQLQVKEEDANASRLLIFASKGINDGRLSGVDISRCYKSEVFPNGIAYENSEDSTMAEIIIFVDDIVMVASMSNNHGSGKAVWEKGDSLIDLLDMLPNGAPTQH